ncbi:hypothetical protein BgiBS90_014033, partial [Biomphalaria glabrata]
TVESNVADNNVKMEEVLEVVCEREVKLKQDKVFHKKWSANWRQWDTKLSCISN